MAAVRLESYGNGTIDLPHVCMRCGAPATLRKRKTFAWFPSWIYLLILCNLLIFAIVALVLTKKRSVHVPLCDEHKNHWLWRQLTVFGTLVPLIVLGFLAMIAMDDRNGRNSASGFLCFATFVGLVIWLIAAGILQSTSIRPSEITDHSITLQGVSREFIRVYREEQHPSPELLDQAARELWSQRAVRRRPADRRSTEASENIRPPDEESPRTPDTFQEGTP